MALATHQVQGFYTAFPSRPLSWNRGMELKQCLTTLRMVARADRLIYLKCKSYLSVGSPIVLGLRPKSLKISAFKGIGQNDESGGRTNGSKSAQDSVKLSYVPHESEETLTESPKVQNIPVPYTSEADERIAGSLTIQNLFKNWLMLLRTPSPNQVVDEMLEGPSSREMSETHDGVQNKDQHAILKAVWCYFWGLDATIKIPLFIFIPLYLVVNLAYGAEVSKELTPMWVLGPLIAALYVKIFQGICALYVFSFKQTFKVVENVPTFYLLVYNYIARGKLKEDLQARLWQPLVDIKNLNYKEVSKRKMKDLQEWLLEKYQDFVESIWPYYCRTIRFLKRANLI